jgi:ClpP class serine protease
MSQQRLPATENDVRPPSEFEYHEMRITQGGKIRAWVDFALKFFEENEKKALVLHTLPAVNKTGSIMSGKTGVDAGDNDDTQANDTATKDKKKGLSPSTTAIPRLITVAEIIKREYLLAMDARRMPDLVGLYQYNEIGCIENGVENEADEETDEGAEDRMKMLAKALEGKK